MPCCLLISKILINRLALVQVRNMRRILGIFDDAIGDDGTLIAHRFHVVDRVVAGEIRVPDFFHVLKALSLNKLQRVRGVTKENQLF